MGSVDPDRTSSERCTAGRRGPARGFTLMEILIALALVAILASIALPSYQEYVQRGKISDALGALSTYRVQLEQYYQDNRNYGSTASACGVALPSSSYFGFSCTWGSSTSSQSYVATATGLDAGGMAGFSFTVNEAGERRTLQFAGTAESAACWKRRRGDTC